jgi:hypothetical protein
MAVKRTSTNILVALVLAAGIICLSSAAKQAENLFAGQLPSQVPFQEAESLRFEVNWKPLFLLPAFKAGEVSFSIRQSAYHQKPTYTISAWATSEGSLTSMIGLKIKNYFESTVDRNDFRSYRLLRKTHQNKKQRYLEVFFDYDDGFTRIHETNLETDPPKNIRDQTIEGIPGPVADVLSVFYLARLRSLQPGETYLIHFSESGKIKPVHVVVQQKERVTTDIGVFDSVRISTVGGLFKGGGEFRIWYSTDQFRLPVQFEADVRFGKISGKIIRLESPRRIRGIFPSPN